MTSQQQPAIEVGQSGDAARAADAERSAARLAGSWRVAFDVCNAGEGPVELIECWLPHGQFRAESVTLTERSPVQPGETVRLGIDVAFDEAPGGRVENGFVILRVRWQGRMWRVLTRMSVTADSDGAPRASSDLTTAHPIGFSE